MFPGPCTTPTRRCCPSGACHRLSKNVFFEKKRIFRANFRISLQAAAGPLRARWQAPRGQDRRVGVVYGPRTVGTCPASSPTMPSRSRDRAESIPGLPGAPRPDPGGGSKNGLKNKDIVLLNKNKPITTNDAISMVSTIFTKTVQQMILWNL